MKKLKVKKISKCQICNGNLQILYSGISDRFNTVKNIFDVSCCTLCGQGVTTPLPSKNIHILYPQNYLLPENISGKFDIYSSYRNDQYRFDFQILTNATNIPISNIKSMLDVGCGSGDRMIYASARGIKKVHGIDKYDNTLGKNIKHIHNGEICDYFPNSKYDLVTLFHVLEHLDSPEEKLKHIANNYLSRKGYLFVQVPNFGSLERYIFRKHWFGLDIPRHLWHFSQTSLCQLLENCGYEIVSVDMKNAILHPVTIAPSIYKQADPQRIWSTAKSNKILLLLCWVILTFLTIPISFIQSYFGKGSMLSVVAKLK